jgi:hypothetical protein
VGEPLHSVAGDPSLLADVGDPHLAGLPDRLLAEGIEVKGH